MSSVATGAAIPDVYPRAQPMWLIPAVSNTAIRRVGVPPQETSQIPLVPHSKFAGFVNTSATFVGNEYVGAAAVHTWPATVGGWSVVEPENRYMRSAVFAPTYAMAAVPTAVNGAGASSVEVTVNWPAMSRVESDGTSAQSLKWSVVTVISPADLFRSEDRTGTQYPDPSWYATVRLSAGFGKTFVLNVMATGALNVTPPADSRYAFPMPRGAVFEIAWIENWAAAESAPGGTLIVSKPSGVERVPPGGPTEPVAGEVPSIGDPGCTGVGRWTADDVAVSRQATDASSSDAAETRTVRPRRALIPTPGKYQGSGRGRERPAPASSTGSRSRRYDRDPHRAGRRLHAACRCAEACIEAPRSRGPPSNGAASHRKRAVMLDRDRGPTPRSASLIAMSDTVLSMPPRPATCEHNVRSRPSSPARSPSEALWNVVTYRA